MVALNTRSLPLSHSGSYRGATKRCLDICLCLVLLPVAVPLVALLCCLVRRDGAPGLFAHDRIGRDGVRFRCWKIRTMVPDAQERLDRVLASDPEARKEWDRDRKLRNDPRVTRLGRVLRRSSLDELPQLWNVLRGEMSLIGPRPVTLPELEKYGARRWAYLSVRPGITGLWQVSGRNSMGYEDRVQLDVAYTHDMSLLWDLWILLRTVGAVLRRTGV